MTYEQFKAAQSALDHRMKATKAVLEKWDNKRHPNGLTPANVRALPEWQKAKAEWSLAFSECRRLNGQYAKQFDKQIRADIDAKRAAILAERASA